MAENGKSFVLPVVIAAVAAGLGRMVLQKLKADRNTKKNFASQFADGLPGADATLKPEVQDQISEAMRGK
ncbi:hypothetical protein ACQR35_09130 [Pseudarthrobacter sp. J1738]|uniref:hypothetical protein n=1 Tax=unclassified Pseudarthrobacter TaxID=2647000 RepID=UPI003D285428